MRLDAGRVDEHEPRDTGGVHRDDVARHVVEQLVRHEEAAQAAGHGTGRPALDPADARVEADGAAAYVDRGDPQARPDRRRQRGEHRHQQLAAARADVDEVERVGAPEP